MNILIIEDEYLAEKRLRNMLVDLSPDIHILGSLESVESSLDWFHKHPFPDLVFLDIHLADGDAFEILQHYPDAFPVIFTTAYDSYAIQAFRYHSIDYILKPIKTQELRAAYQKFLKRNSFPFIPAGILNQTQTGIPFYQNRILLRFGKKIKAIPVDEIAYFFIDQRVPFLKTFHGKNYPVDQNLDKLGELLDPQKFYRLNRQLLASFAAIKEMHAFSKSRIQVLLHPPSNVKALVSTDRSSDFKNWLKGTR